MGSAGALPTSSPESGLFEPKSSPLVSPAPPRTTSPTIISKLLSHGRCNWPGCDATIDDDKDLQRHLLAGHPLDEKATAQTRVQLQIVNQLEVQLVKERDR